jgi:HK97 family phage prohead protease
MRTTTKKPPAPCIRSAMVRAIDEGERRISAVASTEALDAHNTILRCNWDLQRFTANPVLLWMHNDQVLPVGRCENVRVEGKELLFDAVFDDVAPLDNQVWEKYRRGTMRGFSVRFNPLEWRNVEQNGRDVVEYTRSELLEISCAPVPSNAEALRRSVGGGKRSMKRSDLMKSLRDMAEGDGSDEEKKAAGEMYKAMGGDEACKAAEESEAKAAEGEDKPKDDDAPPPSTKKPEEQKAAPARRAPVVEVVKPSGGAVDLAVRVAELEAVEQRRAVGALVEAHKDRFTPATRSWALAESLEVVERYLKRAPKVDARAPQLAPQTRGAGQGEGGQGSALMPVGDDAKLDKILGISRAPGKLGWAGYDPDAGVMRFNAAGPAELRAIRAANNGRVALTKES